MALTWSQRRRFAVIGTAAAAALLLVAGIAFAIIYDVPSCLDNKQNQDEAGVDCGGSCAYLCAMDVQAPRTQLARALPSMSGRTDIVAYIENRNQDAEAARAAYTVELFDDAGRLLGTRKGSMDIPARSVVPLFIPGMAQGVYPGARAFVTFDPGLKWRRASEAGSVPSVRSSEIVAGERPRVVAVLANESPATMYNRTVIATVFLADGSAVAASQAVVREIVPQGTVQAVFTWNEPFPEGAMRVEVRPVPMLP